MKNKIILHIPHSSIHIPALEGFIVDKDSLENEILKLTDWFTDDLFYSNDDEMIKAEFSRIFCDPERFADDSLEIMSQYGMGVLYEKNDEGEVIRRVTPELKERILNDYYWHHHRKSSNFRSKEVQFCCVPGWPPLPGISDTLLLFPSRWHRKCHKGSPLLWHKAF